MGVDLVTAAIAQREPRLAYYQLMRDYYAGRHQLKFSSKDFDAKYADQVAGLRLNVCEPVVSAFTDKLEVETWGDNDEAAEQGLSRLVGMVNREMVRCGDAFVLVWNNLNGEPTPRYLRSDEIVPTVDDDDPSRLARAVRLWVDSDRYGRAMVIDAAGAERYRTTQPLASVNDDLPGQPTGWQEMDDEDGPYVAHDFGSVPVCWFRRDADDTNSYGVSVLDDVIPVQDGINQTLANLLVLAESYSKPFWYLLNFRPTNANNPAMAAQEWQQAVHGLPNLPGRKQDRFKPGEQQIFTHDGPGPFGQLTPADLGRLTTLLQELKVHAAGVAGVPSYYFTQTSGDVPSGESLKVLSSRLTAGVKALQRETGPVWRGVGELLGIDVKIRWAEPMPEPEDVKLANAAAKRDLGVPLAQIFADLGYENPDDLAVQAVEEQQAMADARARSFAEGNLFGA